MRAAVCSSLTGPDGITLETLPDPVPKEGEVVVRVKAAALNFLDTLITRGRYQYKPEGAFSPAAEIAGVVESLGPGSTRLKPGDRVAGYIGWGGAREKVAVKESLLAPVPAGVDDNTAAAVSVTYGTAIHGLKDRALLKAGETVAVLGASGGAGLAAIEVAKLLGARVIAVASTAEKLEVCRAGGADLLLNYAETDLKQGLRELTGGKGVDVVYDCVGGEHTEAAIRSIAWEGRFLVVGFAAGQIPKVPINLMLLKNCALVGVFWGEMVTRHPDRQRTNMDELMGWIASGRLRPHLHATLPLEKTAEGIRLIDARKVTGKVVITI
ncbi:MAG TPA: NADPH:quinone oxidoreductase family protein [Hyphomicrobiaceae bacterium]|nr:NADPH:quinone oxidoreductase family protein [Hyphomicrobiaceae bacterium]